MSLSNWQIFRRAVGSSSEGRISYRSRSSWGLEREEEFTMLMKLRAWNLRLWLSIIRL